MPTQIPPSGNLRLELALGSEEFVCCFPASCHLDRSDASYASFAQSCSGKPKSLTFFADEEAVLDWKTAKPIFTSDVWELRRSSDTFFVIGTAFQPPQPFWLARADDALAHFSVSRLGLRQEIADEHVIAPALRILLRLSLMHTLFEQSSGMVVHSAAATIKGRMYLFPGCSGAGKSTFSRLLLDRPDATLVNDDRMIVTRDEDNTGTWTAWGTPWPGELGVARNHKAPLAAVLFLEKSDRSFLERLSQTEALLRLVSVTSIPWYEQDLAPKALDLCGRHVAEVPAYVLHFRPDESAVDAVMGLLE